MLPLTSRPTLIKLINPSQIIILTSTQLIFTYIAFIEEYLQTKLIAHHPQLVEYHPRTSQVIIANQQAIQVYQTDWKRKVRLRYYLALHEECVRSIFAGQRWCLFGDFKQYSNGVMRLINISQGQGSRCYFGNKCIIMTAERIILLNLFNQCQWDIIWHERQQWMPQIDASQQTKLQAYQMDQHTILLSISNLCLIIKQRAVVREIINKGTCHISGKLIIWQINTDDIMLFEVVDDNFKLVAQFLFNEGNEYVSATVVQRFFTIMIYNHPSKEIQLHHYQQSDDSIISLSKQSRIRNIHNLSIIPPNKTLCLMQSPNDSSFNTLKVALKSCLDTFMKSLNTFVIKQSKVDEQRTLIVSQNDVSLTQNKGQVLNGQNGQCLMEQKQQQQHQSGDSSQAESGCQWHPFQLTNTPGSIP